MALFQIDIEKQLSLEFWTNVYYVAAADITAASSAVGMIVTAERAFHSSAITFTKARVRTAVKGDDIYTTVPLNVLGNANLGGAILPLFNVVRVDIGAPTGRPSRKYYRTAFTAAQVTGTEFTPTYIEQVETALQSMQNQLAVAELTWNDVDGQGLSGFPLVNPKVAMRQLRRGSKRKLQPIL